MGQGARSASQILIVFRRDRGFCHERALKRVDHVDVIVDDLGFTVPTAITGRGRESPVLARDLLREVLAGKGMASGDQTRLIPSPIADSSIAGRASRSPKRYRSSAAWAPACYGTSPARQSWSCA